MNSTSHLLRAATILATAAVTATACTSGDGDDVASSSPASDSTTPTVSAASDTVDSSTVSTGLLAPDSSTHLGLTWFSPPEPDSMAAIMPRWDEAQAASSVGRVMIDWIEIEPERGEYRLDELDDSLADLVDAGLAPMVSIVSVDLSGTEFPAWLEPFDPVTAAEAYVDMVDVVLPTLREHDVWLLAVANEPPLADEDEFDRDAFATFVEEVTRSLDDRAPDLPVTFTFAGGDPFIDDPAIERMRAAVDVLSVNHYCLDASLTALPLSEATAQIDRVLEIAGDLPIVFQEFGCPAGEANGSSDADQLAWFEAAFEHISSIDQIRAAFVFEFLDWSEATLELDYGAAMDELEAEVGADFVERFRSWILTSGLVRGDGTTRPAFDHFLETAAGS